MLAKKKQTFLELRLRPKHEREDASGAEICGAISVGMCGHGGGVSDAAAAQAGGHPGAGCGQRVDRHAQC